MEKSIDKICKNYTINELLERYTQLLMHNEELQKENRELRRQLENKENPETPETITKPVQPDYEEIEDNNGRIWYKRTHFNTQRKDSRLLKKYDVIFIDAAKAQYQKFFDKYAPLLNDFGIILTDNIVFHGCVENQENLSKNVRSMVKKIDNYNHYLNTLDNYVTYYIDSGDGLAITMRKK